MASGIIIHGGIREFENIDASDDSMRQTLHSIANESYQVLIQKGARAAVLSAAVALEDCELFNAGTGSKIQSDGEIRMSASLMDGKRNHFSGVINIQYVKNPILVAAQLSGQKYTVLAGGPATRYARCHGFESHDPYTGHRRAELRLGKSGLTGTVGAVALDENGDIFAATSTGGVCGETPGRVSDSATVAGNYAGPDIGVSCTGSGEQTVNLCVAARIATRKAVGEDLDQAVRNTIDEGKDLGYFFGLIAMDEHGTACVGQTQGKTLHAMANQAGVKTFS